MTSVVIKIGTTDVTADVRIKEATFESKANGKVGAALFRIKDPTWSYSFIIGEEITLTIDGVLTWSGYLMRVNRVYPFDAAKIADTPTRFFDIEGSDINVLLSRRSVFKLDNPTKMSPRFPYDGANTTDVTALNRLFSNWVDLSLDNIDTTTYVENVGYINDENDAIGFGAGMTLDQALASLATLPNAVYYLTPDRYFVWTDVDTANAPYVMSDNPTIASGEIGYRQCEIFNDGTELANDVLLWGTAMGIDNFRFTRVQDTTSKNVHGRWQWSEVRTDIYHQKYLDRRADTYVYGSEGNNKRGHKDDAIAVRVTTVQPGFRVAQKVDFTSTAHGYSDVIPIRRMLVRFEGVNKPLYDLELSHNISIPFNFHESYWPPIRRTPYPKVKPGRWIPGTTTTQTCADVAGITDTFTRSTTNYEGSYYTGNNWGVADAGLQWHGSAWYVWVDGSSGVIGIHPSPFGGGPAWNQQQYLDLSGGAQTFDGTFEAVLNRGLVSGTGDGEYFEVWCGYFSVRVLGTGSVELTDFTNTTSTSTPVTLTSPFKVRLTRTTGDFEVRIWQATDAEPATPTLSLGHTGEYNLFGFYVGTDMASIGSALELRVDNLDIEGLNRVSEYRFDNFNRTVASGSYGGPWSNTGFEENLLSCDGSLGVFNAPSGAYNQHAQSYVVNDPAYTSGAFTMTTKIKAAVVTSTPTYIGTGWQWTRGTGISGDTYWAVQFSSPGYVSGYSDFGGFSSSTSFSFTANTWYNVKVYLDPNVETKIKVWKEGDPEPSAWLLEMSDVGAGLLAGDVLPQFIYDNWGRSNTLYTDYIDFDYDGKPCYVSDGQEGLDNFDGRTLSGSFGWVVIGPASSGLDYSNSNSAYVYYGSLAVENGIMRYTGPPSGYSSSGPMSAYLNPSWAPMSVNPMTAFSFRFRTSFIPPNSGATGPWTVRLDLDTWNGDSIGFKLNVCSTSGYGTVEVNQYMPVAVDAPEPRTIGKTDWAANTWYTVKGVIDGSDFRVRVWKDEEEAEPSTYLVAGQADSNGGDWDLSTNGPYISYYLNLECDTTVYGSDHTFDWDDVSVTGLTSVGPVTTTTDPVWVPPTVQGAPGYTGDVVYGNGTNTITVGFSYRSGSSQVWLNGLRQVRGTHYTESPWAGKIVFTFIVRTTDLVVYLAEPV